jgi:carbon starvation protein
VSSLWIVILSVLTTYLAYNLYARRIDRNIIQPDVKRATPARMYMDGVDFMPTSRNVLFGYHFKAIAAAGPIVGPITAANLWGWAPSLAWLIIGVSFIGWASDYSAIMVAVRNDGNSLSAIAHRLIAPRTRTILFVFIFFYLMLLAGAFIGILAATLSARPDVPFGIIMLGLMGLLAGQMMYRWKMGIASVTAFVVAITIGAMTLGPWGQHRDTSGALIQGPVAAAVTWVKDKVDGITGNQALIAVQDPTMADPRIPPPGADGKRPTTAAYDGLTGQLKTLPNYLFWMVSLFAFSYLGANPPIWRFAQPVNYIGFWITFITVILSAAGMIIAPFLGTTDAAAAGAADRPHPGHVAGLKKNDQGYAGERGLAGPNRQFDCRRTQPAHNRVAMQQEHMQTIWKEFDGSVRAIVPLFETAVRGVPMLQRLCDAMFAKDDSAVAPGASVRPPQHIGAPR